MKLLEYIDEFIEMENSAALFYEKMSATLENNLKNISLTFAKQEKIHAEKLMNVKINIEDREVFLKEDFNVMAMSIITALSKEGLSFSSEKEFFLFALKIEKDTIYLYENFKDLFDIKSNTYEVFSKLISEEKLHMVFILKKLHEFK